MKQAHVEKRLRSIRLISQISQSDIEWFRRKLLTWFSLNQRDFPWRKSSASTYVRILSEVLLQRTKAEVVARFLPVFLDKFPSWSSLAKAGTKQLRMYLRPIGLWKRRAASVEQLAKHMVSRRGRFPRTRDEIQNLPNAGQYITNAVLLFCHGEREPLLDSNMARVLERFFGPRLYADIRFDPYLQTLAKKVVDVKNPIILNWAILDHASLVCTILKPRCRECPLLARCRFGNSVKASGFDLGQANKVG